MVQMYRYIVYIYVYIRSTSGNRFTNMQKQSIISNSCYWSVQRTVLFGIISLPAQLSLHLSRLGPPDYS